MSVISVVQGIPGRLGSIGQPLPQLPVRATDPAAAVPSSCSAIPPNSITLLHLPQGGAGDRAQLTPMEGDACSGDFHSAVPPR